MSSQVQPWAKVQETINTEETLLRWVTGLTFEKLLQFLKIWLVTIRSHATLSSRHQLWILFQKQVLLISLLKLVRASWFYLINSWLIYFTPSLQNDYSLIPEKDEANALGHLLQKLEKSFSTQAALISSSTFIFKHVSAGVLTISQKCHTLPLLWYPYFAAN